MRDARRQARSLPELTPPEPQSPPATDPLLVARGVTVVHGSHVAVREVDLTLSPGRVTVLMGRNGSGKSSLIWALQGSGRRRSGTVDVAGDDPADLAPAERRTHVGLVPQTAADLLYLETVADECAAADTGADAEPGTCRGLLDRLAPGIDDDHPPARPLRGPAARAGAVDRAHRPPAGRAARRADPRPRLRRQGASWRASSPTSPPTTTPSSWPRTTSSSPPTSPTRSS